MSNDRNTESLTLSITYACKKKKKKTISLAGQHKDGNFLGELTILVKVARRFLRVLGKCHELFLG